MIKTSKLISKNTTESSTKPKPQYTKVLRYVHDEGGIPEVDETINEELKKHSAKLTGVVILNHVFLLLIFEGEKA